METTPSSARRWRRRLLYAIGAVGLLLALVLGAVVALVHSLDAAWLKARVVRLVHDKAGVDVDWARLEIDLLSGVRARDLSVKTPEPFRTTAPELAHVGQLEVDWSLSSLLGHGPQLKAVRIRDVAVTLVADDAGGRSLAALSPPSAQAQAAPAPAPPKPLSKTVSDLLGRPPPVGSLDLEGVTLTQIRTAHGAVVERAKVTGIGVRLGAGDKGQWQVGLGSDTAPLTVDLTDERGNETKSARVALWADVAADAAQARVTIDGRVIRQDFVPNLAVDHLLHLAAVTQFDARAGRIQVKLADTQLADGAATVSGGVTLLDDGSVWMRQAEVALDVGRLSALGAPLGVPASVQDGTATLTVSALDVGKLPALSGQVALDATLRGVKAPGEVALDSLHATATVHALASGAPEAKLALTADGFRQKALSAHGLAIDGDLSGGPGQPSSADVTVQVARFEMPGISVEGSRTQVQAKDLLLDPTKPLQARGHVSFKTVTALARVRKGPQRITVRDLRLFVDAPLDGTARFAAEVLQECQVHLEAPGLPAWDEHQTLKVHLTDVSPNLEDPPRITGKALVHLETDAATVTVDGTKLEDGAEATVTARVPKLSVLKRFLTKDRLGLGWEDASLSGSVKARIAHFTTPVAHADLELQLTHLKWGDQHAQANVDLDLPRATVDVKLATSGATGPNAELSTRAVFQRPTRTLVADVDAKASHLGALEPTVRALYEDGSVDLSALAVDLRAHAAVAGVLRSFSPDGSVQVSPKPQETAAGDVTLDASLAHLDWTHADQSAAIPAASAHVDVHSQGGDATANAKLSFDHLHVASGPTQADVTAGKAEVHASGHPRTQDGAVEATLTAENVEQDAVPAYPVSHLSISLAGKRERSGLVRLTRAEVNNPGAGTSLSLHGAVEPNELPPKLSLQATVQQELSKLWTIPAQFTGSGTAGIALSVESPDLHVFRTSGKVTLGSVHVRIPEKNIVVEPIDGEIPLFTTVRVDEGQVRFVHSERVNPYSVLRFEDQHALLSHRSFLSIGSIQTPFLTIAPFAGDIKVEHNVVSLSQMELGVRGGHITGQLILDYDGWKSHLRADIRANGVRSSHDEPFDGNFAMVISAKDRSVDGHAEILRIGRRHLLDLLDLQDPHHTAPAFNRVRQALALGYPDHVRLLFDRGFAAAKIAFGGVASLVRVDELRGIPLEPILNKYLAAPPAEDAKETP